MKIDYILAELSRLRKNHPGKGLFVYARPGLGLFDLALRAELAAAPEARVTVLVPPSLVASVLHAHKRPMTIASPHAVRAGLLTDNEVSAEIMVGRLEGFTGKKTLDGLRRLLDRRLEGPLCRPPILTTTRLDPNLPKTLKSWGDHFKFVAFLSGQEF